MFLLLVFIPFTTERAKVKRLNERRYYLLEHRLSLAVEMKAPLQRPSRDAFKNSFLAKKFTVKLKTGRILQCFCLVGDFPWVTFFFTTEVTIGRSGCVNRSQQVKHLHQTTGAQIKMLAH